MHASASWSVKVPRQCQCRGPCQGPGAHEIRAVLTTNSPTFPALCRHGRVVTMCHGLWTWRSKKKSIEFWVVFSVNWCILTHFFHYLKTKTLLVTSQIKRPIQEITLKLQLDYLWQFPTLNLNWLLNCSFWLKILFKDTERWQIVIDYSTAVSTLLSPIRSYLQQGLHVWI